VASHLRTQQSHRWQLSPYTWVKLSTYTVTRDVQVERIWGRWQRGSRRFENVLSIANLGSMYLYPLFVISPCIMQATNKNNTCILWISVIVIERALGIYVHGFFFFFWDRDVVWCFDFHARVFGCEALTFMPQCSDVNMSLSNKISVIYDVIPVFVWLPWLASFDVLPEEYFRVVNKLGHNLSAYPLSSWEALTQSARNFFY
jgi:hypothetical protein